MSFATKTPPDPASGVAPASVATSYGQPGGKVLTEDDIPGLLADGRPVDEIDALQIVPTERLEEIVRQLESNASQPEDSISTPSAAG